MINFTNFEIMERLLQTLVSKIGRRTHESYAVVTIDTILKTLEPKYDFLKYVTVNDTIHSEGAKAVSVMPEINSVGSDEFYKAVHELVLMTVKYLERNADFFFIREFQYALNDIGLGTIGENLDLNRRQSEYIAGKTQTLQIDNSGLVEHVLKALTFLLNRTLSEEQAIKTVADSIKNFEGKYKFLNYIEMSDTPDSKGFYIIRALPDINNVFSAGIAEALQKIIREVSISIEWEGEESFIDAFKSELGEKQLSEIEKIGVNLSHIQTTLSRMKHEEITKKALDALVKIVGERTHESFAVVTIDNIIKKLEETYDALKYIKIDKSRCAEGANAISIMPEVNNVEPYELAKALRDIIKMTGTHLGNKTTSFIEDFKKQFGEEYIQEIEKIGVNLHFLELKFM